ncbi:MAG: ABC transporter ATP-binding protein [Pseudomonadota bacterium]
MKLLSFVWAYLPPKRGQYVTSLALTGVEGLLTATPPLAVGLGLMQLARGNADFASIWPYAAACFLAVLIRIYVIGQAWKLGYGAGNYASEQVRNRIVDHMRKVPLGALTGRWSPSKLATLITEDGRWINETSTFYLVRFLNGFVATLMLVLFAAMFEPLAAVGLALAMGGGVLLMVTAKPFLESFIHKRNDMVGEATLRIGEYADGIAVFRSFGRADEAQKSFRSAVQDMHDTTLSVAPVIVPLQQSGAALITFAAPIVIVLVAALHLSGVYSADPMTLIPALFLVLAAATTFLVGVLRTTLPLELGSRAETNISAFLSSPELGGTRTDFSDALGIEFERVSFRYSEDKADAVSKVSFTTRKGAVTAIVGPSGAGKSTLISLLLRFHDRSDGEIRLGGLDTLEADPAAVQSMVSLVSQDVHLFRDTLRANLLLGDPSASDARLAQVIDAARLTDLVAALPDGLDTMLGDTGKTLSGGERQRVAIARALLKDAPVIVLDEATSAMDPITERAIQEAIAELEDGRSVIVIAHRLRTVIDADEILVLDQGRIAARGTHTDLLNNDPLYGRLWAAQEKAAGWRLR